MSKNKDLREEFSGENEYGLDPDQVKKVKKTPEHSKDKMLEAVVDEKSQEFVEAMEGDEESARDYVEEQEKGKIKKAQERKDAAMNFLDMSSGFSSYRTNAAEFGMLILMSKFFPQGYEYHCIPTSKGSQNIYGKVFDTQDGILFVLKEPKGKVFVRAMKCSYDPMIDVPALEVLSVQMENTVDMLEGKLIPTKSDDKDKIWT